MLLRAASSVGRIGLLSTLGISCLGLQKASSSKIGTSRSLLAPFSFLCTFPPDLGRGL